MSTIPDHIGFYRFIYDNYGSQIIGKVRHYIRTAEKIATFRQHLHFNLRAKRYHLIPRSLQVKPLVNTKEGRTIAETTSRRFLLARISQNAMELKHLEQDLRCQNGELRLELQDDHLSTLQSMKDNAQTLLTKKCKERQKHKFDLLLAKSNKEDLHECTDKWVINHSSRQLNLIEKKALSKGLNFTPAPKSIPIPRIVAAVETGLRKVPSSEAELARINIIGALTKAKPPPSNITTEEYRAIKDLKKDNSILILPADKGRATVILDKSEYHQKILSMLSDDKTYKKLKRDPALALERKMNSLLLSLKRAGSLPDALYYRLRSSAKTTPLLYGLPKIHKPNTPLRPIVSFINSPTYILSKHLVTILSPLVGNSSTHVKNSFDFAKFISTQCIPSGTVLVSFDVVSLFTTIPTKKPIDVARQRLSVDSRSHSIIGIRGHTTLRILLECNILVLQQSIF